MSKERKAERKLFGTDGIRGTANSFPMTVDVALRLGQAAGSISVVERIVIVSYWARIRACRAI